MKSQIKTVLIDYLTVSFIILFTLFFLAYLTEINAYLLFLITLITLAFLFSTLKSYLYLTINNLNILNILSFLMFFFVSLAISIYVFKLVIYAGIFFTVIVSPFFYIALLRSNKESLNLYGVLLMERGDFENALTYFNKALDSDEEYFNALINKVISLVVLNKCSDALSTSEKCVEIKPKNYISWVMKGNAYECLNDCEKAIKIYDKVLSINPKFAEAISEQALCLAKLENYSDALKYCDRALKLKPNYEYTWYIKGYVLEKLGKHKESMACYGKFSNSFRKLSAIQLQTSLRFFKYELKNEPDLAVNWFAIGVILQHLGKDGEAISALNKALELDSTFEPAVEAKGKF